MTRRATRTLATLAATAALTAMDLGSKHWALERLSQPASLAPESVCQPNEYGRIQTQRAQRAPVVLIDGYLEFRYAENCGAAFGFMRDMPTLVRKGVFYVAAAGAVRGPTIQVCNMNGCPPRWRICFFQSRLYGSAVSST